MKKLNHLRTYESFNANEEFNPFKKEDWKDAGHSVRRGAGFLTSEEEFARGENKVQSHPALNTIYKKYLNTDPKRAKEFIKFWGKSGHIVGESIPVWNDKLQKFEDKAEYSGSYGV